MVAPLGCHPIREAPLRTRGTRGLPESGMPHSSSLIHQIWLSHCNMHKQRNKHTKRHTIIVTAKLYDVQAFKNNWKAGNTFA